jgi:predicted amidohydrolase YtcJ
VRCGPPQVRDREGLARALRAARPVDGWLRGVGYHESVCGALDRALLDALCPEHPLRVQQRSGALWVLNSAGVERLGLDRGADAPGVERDTRGRATGRLLRADAWLRERLGPRPAPDLAAVGRRLASFGVSGVTDATPGNAADELRTFEEALARGALRQRLLVMGGDELPEPGHPLLERGPRKVMLAESELPRFEELVETVARAHAAGRAVAVHCVTRAELVFALEAFRTAGARAGDRIEHAAVTPPELLDALAALPLCVVTQPHFVSERGDAYLCDVEPEQRPWLYRARAFRRAGVALGGGSDAPFGAPDPWLAMRAAVERRSATGQVLGAEEALEPEQALALFSGPPGAPGGPPRRVAPGATADLCLLDRPWAEARRALSSQHVRATWRGGCPVWRRA